MLLLTPLSGLNQSVTWSIWRGILTIIGGQICIERDCPPHSGLWLRSNCPSFRAITKPLRLHWVRQHLGQHWDSLKSYFRRLMKYADVQRLDFVRPRKSTFLLSSTIFFPRHRQKRIPFGFGSRYWVLTILSKRTSPSKKSIFACFHCDGSRWSVEQNR